MTAADLSARVTQILAQKPVSFADIQRGYTPAKRLVVTLTDGSSVFIKVGTTDLTARWLRQEQNVYEKLSGSFMPHYIGWDDGEQPLLVLEDLSRAYWPPPWTDTRIKQVIEMLQTIAATQLPGAQPLQEADSLTQSWATIAADPQPFLSLGLATEAWLAKALPTLLAIPYGQVIQGNGLLHLDVRSDNICFVDDRAILVDWNNACLGNPDLDIAAWLPSLAAEGGPLPETILPDGAELSAIISGFMAARAGLPRIPDAPHVRDIQLVQAKTALPWTVRALDLPPLDGDIGKHR